MKKNFKTFATILVLCTLGFAFSSCSNGSSGDEDAPKEIAEVITEGTVSPVTVIEGKRVAECECEDGTYIFTQESSGFYSSQARAAAPIQYGTWKLVKDDAVIYSGYFEGDISKYFDVVSATAHDSAGNSLPITVNNNKFSASGIKASPSSTAGEGKSSLIELKLKPVNGFMGGNDVPIFKQENVTYSYTKQSVPHTADMGLIEKCSYVNVPYAFDLTTHNYTKSGSAEEPCTELKVSDLFDDKGYVAEKADASKSYLYDFIDSVTDYVIQSDGATYEKSEQLSLKLAIQLDQRMVQKLLLVRN